MFRTLLPLIFSTKFFEKIFAFLLLILVGYFLRDFLALFLITFIFAYIFLSLGELLSTKLHTWGTHGQKSQLKRYVTQYSGVNSIVTVFYILFIILIVLLFVNIVPKIGNEIENLVKNAPRLANQGQELIQQIEEKIGLHLGADEVIGNFFNEESIKNILQNALTYIKDAGAILMKFFIGIILSYVFIMERTKVQDFFRLLQDGNFRFLYREYAIIAGKIGRGFGAIFKAQSIIALANAILTIIGLLIIGPMTATHPGNGSFPFIFTLSLIVFIFGFIPVFGTILSSVPIIIIGYGYGGLDTVIGIIMMILIVHAVEAYILNPKIVSSYIHFPVFITFLTLIVSEHLFGLVGLLIGVPLLSILLGFFEDFDRYISEIKKTYHSRKHVAPRTEG